MNRTSSIVRANLAVFLSCDCATGVCFTKALDFGQPHSMAKVLITMFDRKGCR